MKNFLIGRSPLTTLTGLLLALVAGIHQAATTGAHHWQDFLVPVAMALLGRLAADDHSFRAPRIPGAAPDGSAASNAEMPDAVQLIHAFLDAAERLGATEYTGTPQIPGLPAFDSSSGDATHQPRTLLDAVTVLMGGAALADFKTVPAPEAAPAPADTEKVPPAQPFLRRGRVLQQRRGRDGRFSKLAA